ncbi:MULTISPECIES: hypothetical protein [unclassified Thalassotalea]|uniref:hypothetical protein n=1 Tax=unclassified Thalassotalea TaxID=2614972 RepID=UPI0010800D39|nr:MULTISPECIES: hypothetical protein [unclassified Thalassotalea]NMP17241.1 hypothetical protein [Thalassotalea sp. Y01]QBY03833.1 hypothetical protein E2K93_05310 [Thalassotalea sp. HSM 43]
MKNLTSKAAVFASVLGLAAMAPGAANAEQVSLETYLQYVVAQQSESVFNAVAQEVAYNIEETVANFNIDSVFSTEKGTPSVTISETTARVESSSSQLSDEAAENK